MAERLPRVLLRAEGAVVAVAAVVLFFHDGHPWWLLAALALAPDISALGFLAGNRVGAITYDAAHTYVLPAALALAALLAGGGWVLGAALVWLTHIGVDRATGYGLKYPTGFKDTHLQRV